MSREDYRKMPGDQQPPKKLFEEDWEACNCYYKIRPEAMCLVRW